MWDGGGAPSLLSPSKQLLGFCRLTPLGENIHCNQPWRA
jgi:hypothetical protein